MFTLKYNVLNDTRSVELEFGQAKRFFFRLSQLDESDGTKLVK